MPCDLLYRAVFIPQNPEGFCVVPSSEIKLGNHFSFLMVNLALSSKKAFDVWDRIIGQSKEIIGERSEPTIQSQFNSVARENVEERLN